MLLIFFSKLSHDKHEKQKQIFGKWHWFLFYHEKYDCFTAALSSFKYRDILFPDSLQAHHVIPDRGLAKALIFPGNTGACVALLIPLAQWRGLADRCFIESAAGLLDNSEERVGVSLLVHNKNTVSAQSAGGNQLRLYFQPC